jgi:ABC-type branched-subunit amino acid transport system substrate-binding protein
MIKISKFSNTDSSDLCEECREVKKTLRIDIYRLFQDLELNGSSDAHARKRRIICKFIKGDTRQEIANSEGCTDNAIGQLLANSIYPSISKLLTIDGIQNNWAKTIYYLLAQGYRLGEPCPISSINTLMSFGNYVFLHRRTPAISRLQLSAALDYSEADYYSALAKFLRAWKTEQKIDGNGNPETLIYTLNCLLEHNKQILRQKGVEKYTIAVVVPIEHNSGKVAAELLYGVAQMQLKINLLNLLSNNVDVKTCNSLMRDIGLERGDYFNHPFNRKIVLQVLIVDESQSLQYDETVNQAAEDLARRADELEIVAVLGHYASEMTKSALNVYTSPRTRLFLLTPSSTSDELSDLVESFSFFRMTTPDRVATERLANYLASLPIFPQRVAIIYNENSSYCSSFKRAICQHFQQQPEKFQLLPECGKLSNGYFQSIQPYLAQIIERGVTTIIIIPDGGIEPKSLTDTQAISLSMNNCLIAGSATFYHDNVLDWVQQNVQRRLLDIDNVSNLVASVPWHYRSIINSTNPTAINFCRLGNNLWGEGKLTWRSATAYDALLTVVQHLPINHDFEGVGVNFVQGRILLRDKINSALRGADAVGINGVTGEIRFDENGDRISPQTEIVAVTWNSEEQRYKFVPVELLSA